MEPLAYRMRPKTIEEVVGQDHIIGKDTLLYKSIQNGHVPSMLLYGDPGTGKTSLAYAIAGSTKLPFYALNATNAGKKDIEAIVQEARLEGQVILFIDEIHRFNKLQQDTLLPHVENGSVILIGATTENPFHDVNPAIRSRCGEIKQLKRLQPEDIEKLLLRALQDEKNGYGKKQFDYTETQLQQIAQAASGDARKALTLLESIIQASDEEDGKIHLEDGIVNQILSRRALLGDKKGSHFYNLLSALQKSIRGSDINAAMYYLAHLLENGDLKAVCRRLIVIAYEDIGLAKPEVGAHVLSAVDAAERVGLPEARIPLAVAVSEMCLSEKSNSAYKAFDQASSYIQQKGISSIPDFLKDAHYEGAKELGAVGYEYPHNTPIGSFGGWNNQTYLPEEIKQAEFYVPVLSGQEVKMAKIYEKLKQFKNK